MPRTANQEDIAHLGNRLMEDGAVKKRAGLTDEDIVHWPYNLFILFCDEGCVDIQRRAGGRKGEET